MSKKGLLVIYSPQHLIQFIWYYCTYANGKKWDALCLPNCLGAKKTKEFCEKSGIFEEVYYNDKFFLESSLKERAVQFSKMLGAFCVGKKQQYIKRFLSEYVNLDLYDEINVLSDHALVSGGFVELSKEKKTVIMEDGTADYKERTFMNIYKKPLNILNTEGFILSLLGYANVAYFYPLKANSNCIKFSSRPNKMKYVNYKSILQLYDYSNTNMELYKKIIKNTYGDILDFPAVRDTDMILFSTPVSDYTDKPEKYLARLEKHIAESMTALLLKKHPRDKADYSFEEKEHFQIPQTIPSEALFPCIMNKKLVFADLSSILLNIPKDADVECLYFDGLNSESLKGNTYEKYPDFERFKEMLSFFDLENVKITRL